MLFIAGNSDGNPFFDLRQDIEDAYLNGLQVPVNKLRRHDFGGGINAGLIVLEEIVHSRSENILKLSYQLKQPQSPNSQPIGWNSPRLYFEFWFSDLYPSRYLEMWFPSNLIYDHFIFDLNVAIINTEIEHVIRTNGAVNQLEQNHWTIHFPERFTSLSPMLCIGSCG